MLFEPEGTGAPYRPSHMKDPGMRIYIYIDIDIILMAIQYMLGPA